MDLSNASAECVLVLHEDLIFTVWLPSCLLLPLFSWNLTDQTKVSEENKQAETEMKQGLVADRFLLGEKKLLKGEEKMFCSSLAVN